MAANSSNTHPLQGDSIYLPFGSVSEFRWCKEIVGLRTDHAKRLKELEKEPPGRFPGGRFDQF